ncbi:MAG: hypothetical protein HQ574_01215 [Chloroflexi bacterium]|nr:hypothetical protein [Chloroflexota bacterium]
MNKTLRVSLIVIIILVGSATLVWTGYRFGQSTALFGEGNFYPDMMGYGDQESNFSFNRRSEMMGGADYGMTGPGMRGGFGSFNDADPLKVDDVRDAVESYLEDFDDQDLVIDEIMIFDNNAYAIVIEESTGIGAFELLVDPLTKTAFPEYGPNMMWNLKYGMMGSGMMGSGMMGSGMMDGFFNNGTFSGDFDTEMSISAEEALLIAQKYLDQDFPGIEVSDEITQFYGYYTIDTERAGDIVGMLSVNGFSGQVFPHIWHGEFIEMVEG